MKRISRQSGEQKMMHRWWVRAILAVLFLGIAYGFASLAIDSARILEYAGALFFLFWALRELTHSVRFLFNR